MYKVVFISTHGVSTVEGTPLHCYSCLDSMQGNFSYAFVYDQSGKLERAEKAKHHCPVDEFFRPNTTKVS